jgi:hypothetical protein
VKVHTGGSVGILNRGTIKRIGNELDGVIRWSSSSKGQGHPICVNENIFVHRICPHCRQVDQRATDDDSIFFPAIRNAVLVRIKKARSHNQLI